MPICIRNLSYCYSQAMEQGSELKQLNLEEQSKGGFIYWAESLFVLG